MDENGLFVAQQAGTSGALIPCADALVVEYLTAQQNPTSDDDAE
jgi:hypothetical protein